MTAVAPSIDVAHAATLGWDVMVIGAGPAGALSALGAARAGLSVLLVERSGFPRPKVCGCCLNAHALSALDRAGLLDRVRGLAAADVHAVELHHGTRRARLDLPRGLAVSREALDAELVRAAIEAGAAFLPDTRAMVTVPSSQAVRHVSLRPRGGGDRTAAARVVLVADGLGHASLRDCPDMLTDVGVASRIGIGGIAPGGTIPTSAGTVTMAIGRRGYVGAVEVDGGRQAVAAAVDPAFLRSVGKPADALRAIVSSAGLTAEPALEAVDWMGTLPLTRHMRRPAAGRLLVLGDAAGYVEPFTGEGMAWALADGEAVLPLVQRGVCSWQTAMEDHWVSERARRISHEQRWCRALSALLRRPWLVVPLLTLLRLQPRLARPMLAHLTPRASPM